MSGVLARLTGTPIRWQIVALLVITQFAAHAVTITLVRDALVWSGTRPGGLAAESLGQFTTTLRIASTLGAGEGDAVLRAAVQSDSRFRFAAEPPRAAGPEPTAFDENFQEALRASVPAAWRDRLVAYEIPAASLFLLPGRSLGAAVPMADGTWFIFEQSKRTIWGLIPSAVLLLGVLILAIPLALLAIWSSSVLVSPISSLATGAERFSRDLDTPAIPVRGAREIRIAAAAFNAMRVRIQRLVEDRSRTLAAISHDMRTPLTRLKLRAEGIDDPALRRPIMGDIDIIERMIGSALSFLRSQRQALALTKTDLAALTQTVVANLADQDLDARYEGPDRLVVTCDSDLVRRALENVTNNAVAHAGSLVARLHPPVGGWVDIEVLDEGPGIADAHRTMVMEPFNKADAARPVAEDASTPGFGLGLAITRTIVEAHGGSLALEANRPRGLVVTIRLPTHPDQDALPSLDRAGAAGPGLAS